MLKSAALKEDSRFPSWISGHSIFKKYDSFEKIFPEVGLPNQELSIKVDNSEEIKQAALSLLKEMSATITYRLSTITRYAEIRPFGEKRKVKHQACCHFLKALRSVISKSPSKSITTAREKTTLNLHTHIADLDGKVVFKSGEGLFKVYNKINEFLRLGHFLSMPKLEELSAFKVFSTINIPKLQYKLVFSSDGIVGAWDIATMSMRGIQSCQSWGQNNATHVVGSIIDPFTGIIYLTSNANPSKYGSRMIRRCIVRFVIGKKTKKPCLMLEKMYPGHDNATEEEFKSFLIEKTNNKFPIFFSYASGSIGPTYVPLAPTVASLSTHDQPYRDSAIAYLPDEKDPLVIRTEAKALLDSASYRLADKFCSWSTLTLSSLPKEDRQYLRLLKAQGTSINIKTMLDNNYLATFGDFLATNKCSDPWKAAVQAFEHLKENHLRSILKSSILKFFNDHDNAKSQPSDQSIEIMLNHLFYKTSSQIDKEIAKLLKRSVKFSTQDNNSASTNGDKTVYIRFLKDAQDEIVSNVV